MIGQVHEIATYRFEDAPSRARRRVRHGDVIISTVRTYLQAIAQIENPPENLIVSTGFAVVRPRPDAFKVPLAIRRERRTIRGSGWVWLEEVNLIVEQLHKWARRFFLALCTTGCRLGEIQKANIGDVSFDRGTLRVIRKGGKPQQIPLNPEALAYIEDEVKFGPRDSGRSRVPISRYSQTGTVGDTTRFEDH